MAGGTILNGFIYGAVAGLRANVPGDHYLPLGAREAYLPDANEAGALHNVQPITIRSVAKTGSIAATFANDWYNRIHIAPQTIDFGPVIGGSAKSTVIWNAYLSNSTLSSITVQNGQGITLNGLPTPKTFKPLEYVIVTATASVDGPMTINAEYTFVFNRPDAVVLNLEGTRSHLWPFVPNWRESVDVNLEYLTDVITSRSGREQRRALRATPRRQIQYTVTLKQPDVRTFDLLMRTWQSRPWLLGDPVRRVSCDAGAPPAASQLVVDDLPAWLAAEQLVLIGDSITATVDEVDPDTNIVTFAAPLTNGVPAGTVIRPALSGRFTGQMSASRPSSSTTEVKITLDVTPGSEPDDIGGPGYSLLSGREVFARRMNWGSDVSDAFTWEPEKVDFGFGPVAYFNPVEFGTTVRQANFVAQTPEDATDIAQFFGRQRGRRGEFLFPTWLNDLPPKSSLVSGSNFIRLTGTDVYFAYKDDVVFKAIAIILDDDTRIYREIQSIGLVSDVLGDDAIIYCTTEWLTDYPLARIKMVSWMPVMRFATDQLTVEWLTSDVSQIAAGMQTLEYLPAEGAIPDLDGAAQWVLEVFGGEFGLQVLDRLDFAVNIEYPAIFYIPEAWAFLYEPLVDRFGALIEHYREVVA